VPRPHGAQPTLLPQPLAVRGQRWEWSDEVPLMHGYEPGSVVPTTKLLLSHKHPDDRAHVQELLDYALHSGESFSSRHRFLDTTGNVQKAIVVADRMLDGDGGSGGHRRLLTSTGDRRRRISNSVRSPSSWSHELAGLAPTSATVQSQFDHLLPTLHERIPQEASSYPAVAVRLRTGMLIKVPILTARGRVRLRITVDGEHGGSGPRLVIG
jgi:hypothetical protein